MTLSARYYARLKLDPVNLDAEPTLDKLKAIHEAHLSQIPFENLGQHGAGPRARLDVTASAHKILDKSRGGFCFELNGLLAALLEELQYEVTRAPAVVHNPEAGFDRLPSHMILLVQVSDKAMYLVDVGFGEPPLHPLRYIFDEEQATPEGMVSKIARQGDDVILYWKGDTDWKPRLKWSYSASMLGDKGPLLSAFANGLSVAHNESSLFHQKIVVTRLTRSEKRTLAGSRLRVTSPRFLHSHAIDTNIKTVDDVRVVLEDQFFMPMDSTEGLDRSKSFAAPLDAWASF